MAEPPRLSPEPMILTLRQAGAAGVKVAGRANERAGGARAGSGEVDLPWAA